jgi:catechol 2,3-dioxygenase-like lactoylglutathione lyase family enzyme
MASPKKLSHIVLQTNRRREMIDWYCTVLGAEILYEAERISFISYDDEHHRVAFLDPGPLADRQPDAAGLNHVAFTFAGLDDLTDNYLRLEAIGIRLHRCVTRGVTFLDIPRSRPQPGRALGRQFCDSGRRQSVHAGPVYH